MIKYPWGDEMELSFEPARESDIPCVLELCKSLIDAYENVSQIDYQRVLLWVYQKLRKQICNYNRIVMDGTVVGYYFLREMDGKLELDDFYVLPSYRSRGIGTVVLEHCLRQAHCPVFLYVFSKNVGAISLYRRFGFEKVKEVGTTRWIMEWNPAK